MKRVAIIGASGGIGSSFVDLLSGLSSVKSLYLFSREKLEVPKNSRWLPLDFNKEDSIAKAAEAIKDEGPLDTLIVATGVLHNSSSQPERSLRDISLEAMNQIFAVNTFGPALALKHFGPLMTRKEKCLIAVLSARVGSISDNYLGGWYSYRSSKAALNMIIKCASIEFKRKNPKSVVVGLHPGTVDTNLSKPFQKNIPRDQLKCPDNACRLMFQVMKNLDSQDSGKCLAYDGKEIQP